jgi:hypothetical protein
MAAATGTRRVNFNLPQDMFDSLQKLSTTSGCTLTELVHTALAVAQEAYAAQAAGGGLVVTSKDGTLVKSLLLPIKPLQTFLVTGQIGTLKVSPDGVLTIDTEATTTPQKKPA